MENPLISELIDACWLDTAGVAIEPTEGEDLDNDLDLYIGSVVYTKGTHQGSLSIAIPENLAKNITAKMFDTSEAEVTLDDIQDCIGEITNVLAGNLKTDFFGDNNLSKPFVSYGSSSLISSFKIDAIFQKNYSSQAGEQLVIQVCKTN